jgi:hypothetical protein
LIDDVPSCGVVSTADKWIFTRHIDSEVYRSAAFKIPLETKATKESVMEGMIEVVLILVEILSDQESCS